MQTKISSIIIFVIILFNGVQAQSEIYIRVNQIGYKKNERKVAIAFSNSPAKGHTYEIIDTQNEKAVWGPGKIEKNIGGWGNFDYHYKLDFSDFEKNGLFRIKISGTDWRSQPFRIGENAYDGYTQDVIGYLQQQRCGYNPFFDEVCHPRDGRTVYGPMPDSTFIDVTGGWHDAGDHLQYLLTSGNSVCRMLFTYRENKGKFKDEVDRLGHKVKNGIPDILDEAKWGLDWMLKMHPKPDQLFHQIADDRDHIGFKVPFLDSADYGWGKGSYRVVYFANGKPQGLKQYQNTSDGLANLAGRYAAAMAMAYDIWKNDLDNELFAERCLQAGKEVYEMGLDKPGCQEGTPCRAPYRYYESSWADDMEWGAAELFKVTEDEKYLKQSKKFARLINTTSWMGQDTARHYEYYPFTNIGHYALWQVADEEFQDTLANYYRVNIQGVQERAQNNPYNIGIPFIWCSNNLAAAFVTQCVLYEKMTGDTKFHALMQAHRDWLLGRNPWGVSQIVGVPEYGRYPNYPHTAVTEYSDRLIVGGLNDGPVYASIYESLKGINLRNKDKYARFQSDIVVYHDDIGDYSTNEPTLDGSAETLFFLTHFTTANERE